MPIARRRMSVVPSLPPSLRWGDRQRGSEMFERRPRGRRRLRRRAEHWAGPDTRDRPRTAPCFAVGLAGFGRQHRSQPRRSHRLCRLRIGRAWQYEAEANPHSADTRDPTGRPRGDGNGGCQVRSGAAGRGWRIRSAALCDRGGRPCLAPPGRAPLGCRSVVANSVDRDRYLIRVLRSGLSIHELRRAASSTNQSSEAGLASESRLAACSAGVPIKIRFTGTSSTLPESVRGTSAIA